MKKKLDITEEQARVFEAQGYHVVRSLYVILPEADEDAPKVNGKERADPMGQYTVLRFHELDKDKLPKGRALAEFYQKVWEEFQSVNMADMRRSCLTKLMIARYPQHNERSVRAQISKMVHDYHALSVVPQTDTGEA